MTGSRLRVLIVRLSAIGDCVHTLPVLCALRDRFPEAEISWVVRRGATASILRGHEALDRLVEVPKGWLGSPWKVWRLRRELRRLGAEITIDAQGLTKSAVAARLSGAKRRIGFAPPVGRELSPWLNTELVAVSNDHVIDWYLQLLKPLGIESPEVRFGLREAALDGEAARRMLAESGIDGPFAVINPGAGWPSKVWPAERFAAVARELDNTHGLRSVVVWAGPKERENAERIARGSGGAAWMAPDTSLREVAALARRARLFVSSDTGPLHLAVAVGTPCVGLYGPMPAARCGPYGPQHIAVQKTVIEGTCRERRGASDESMRAISVEDVSRACEEILSRPSASHAA